MVETAGLSREFELGSTVVQAITDVGIRVERGELVAIRGRSGSGKTTLLSLIGGLDRPTAGDIVIDGTSLAGMSQADLVDMRRRRVGFIFQAFGLLSILSAAENVEVPLRLVAADGRLREERVGDTARSGRSWRARQAPPARAVRRRATARGDRPGPCQSPGPVTGRRADRPARFGTGRSIMTLLRSVVRSEGVTALIATHDPMLLDVADRVVELRDGRVVDSVDDGVAGAVGEAARAAPPGHGQSG